MLTIQRGVASPYVARFLRTFLVVLITK